MTLGRVRVSRPIPPVVITSSDAVAPSDVLDDGRCDLSPPSDVEGLDGQPGAPGEARRDARGAAVVVVGDGDDQRVEHVGSLLAVCMTHRGPHRGLAPGRRGPSTLGRGHARPQGGVMATDGTTVLDTHTCLQLLRTREVGRLAVSSADHPDIFPINYVLDRGTVVFRTAEGTKLAAALLGAVWRSRSTATSPKRARRGAS